MHWRRREYVTRHGSLDHYADQDPESLTKAWFYVPRMLHAGSLVFLEQPAQGPNKTSYQLLALSTIDGFAAAQAKIMRRVA